MQVVSQDHFAIDVVYAPGRFSYSKETVGTRYVFLIIRTLANPEDSDDVKAANALQDAVAVEQRHIGSFEVPAWDTASQDKVRDALAALGSFGGTTVRFDRKDQVDPISHLIGTVIGWGGNPERTRCTRPVPDGERWQDGAHDSRSKDVPVDGFWSISVYNAKGYFEQNDHNAYSLNSITAKPNPDGAVTVQFGGCVRTIPNCLPIMPGWNYTVRLYRPRKVLLDGNWQFPEAQPVK